MSEIVKDRYSDLYLASRRDKAVDTISVTRASAGTFETEDAFPSRMVEELRPQLCFAYRLAVPDKNRDVASLRLGRQLMRASFSYGLRFGLRLVVITTTQKLFNYYLKAGCVPIRSHGFVHPRLGTLHFPMALPADPARFAENLERQLPVVVAPRQQARRRRPGEQHRLRPRVGVNEQKLKE